MQHHFLKNRRVKAEIHFKKLKIFVAWRKQMLLRDLVGFFLVSFFLMSCCTIFCLIDFFTSSVSNICSIVANFPAKRLRKNTVLKNTHAPFFLIEIIKVYISLFLSLFSPINIVKSNRNVVYFFIPSFNSINNTSFSVVQFFYSLIS